jgi:hypothetical protein
VAARKKNAQRRPPVRSAAPVRSTDAGVSAPADSDAGKPGSAGALEGTEGGGGGVASSGATFDGEAERPQALATTFKAAAAPPVDTTGSVGVVKAMAAKISAARHLARRLADERDAKDDPVDSDDEGVRETRAKSRRDTAGAAAAAARADPLSRSAWLQGTARGREAARLAEENKALLAVLSEAAGDNPTLAERLTEIRARYKAAEARPQQAPPTIRNPARRMHVSRACGCVLWRRSVPCADLLQSGAGSALRTMCLVRSLPCGAGAGAQRGGCSRVLRRALGRLRIG